jgi:hypothetical protein
MSVCVRNGSSALLAPSSPLSFPSPHLLRLLPPRGLSCRPLSALLIQPELEVSDPLLQALPLHGLCLKLALVPAQQLGHLEQQARVEGSGFEGRRSRGPKRLYEPRSPEK